MAEFGFVKTHVYTSVANLPLQGVTIVLSRRLQDGRREILAARKTDSSGNTEPIQVATPNTAVSQTPGNTIPFSYIDITADLPLFEQVLVQDVQVFPGVITLQEIQMLPLDTLYTRESDTQQVEITPQDL